MPKHVRVIEDYTKMCVYVKIIVFVLYSSTAPVGLDLLYEVPRSHSDTPHSVGLLWTSDQPDAQTST